MVDSKRTDIQLKDNGHFVNEALPVYELTFSGHLQLKELTCSVVVVRPSNGSMVSYLVVCMLV